MESIISEIFENFPFRMNYPAAEQRGINPCRLRWACPPGGLMNFPAVPLKQRDRVSNIKRSLHGPCFPSLDGRGEGRVKKGSIVWQPCSKL